MDDGEKSICNVHGLYMSATSSSSSSSSSSGDTAIKGSCRSIERLLASSCLINFGIVDIVVIILFHAGKSDDDLLVLDGRTDRPHSNAGQFFDNGLEFGS